MKSRIKSMFRSLRLLHDRWVDRSLNINTTCHMREKPEGAINSDSYPYSSPAWAHVRLLVRELQLGPKDIFVDYGCGAGRILCEVARWDVQRVVGVEISKPLVAIANNNLEHMKGRNSPFEIHEGDAAEFVPLDCTVAFFFNPFGQLTMSAVLENLALEARRSGRDIKLIYLHTYNSLAFEERDDITLNRVLKWASFMHPANVYTLSANSNTAEKCAG